MKKEIVIWTKESEDDIDKIYEYYANISINLAQKIISEIIFETERLVFTNQYQVDDINPKYRRIIIDNYKILYKAFENEVVIYSVFDCRRDFKKLKKL